MSDEMSQAMTVEQFDAQFEAKQTRWRAEIAATPTPSPGDWVLDWAPRAKPFIWTRKYADRLSRHPVIARYLIEIRGERNGVAFIWRREAQS